MARFTGLTGVGACQRKTGGSQRMVKYGRVPAAGGMTQGTIFRAKSLGLVVGIGRVVKIPQVALSVAARCWRASVYVINVALITAGIAVFPDQGKTGLIMVENVGLPGAVSMADLALGAEAIGRVIWGRGLIVIVLMACRTGGSGVSMQKNPGLEGHRIVADFTDLRWVAPGFMIRSGGLGVFPGMTPITVAGNAGPLIINVATGTLVRDQRCMGPD